MGSRFSEALFSMLKTKNREKVIHNFVQPSRALYKERVGNNNEKLIN